MKLVAVTGVLAAVLSVAAPASAAQIHHTVTVTVDEHQNHQTVTVHRGDRIRVVLHNTYWSIDRAHGQALETAGRQHTHGRVGAGCVPGAGCGTATRSFIAGHRGTARLTADRVTCGEAMRCTGDNGVFSVKIRVVR
jgi:hypothetical protein